MRLCRSVPAGRSWGRVPHVSDILEGPPCFASDEGQEPARNVGMRDASRHSLVHDDQGALAAAGAAVPGALAARGRGGCHPQRGWRESVTVTWSPAPAPDRRAAAGTGAAAAGNPGSSGAVITTTQTLTYLGVRVGWPGKSRDLLRAPQNPHKSATRRRIPTGIPRTERHTPVHLLYVLKARRTADQQPRCA
jgi:hypothetical protein